MEESETKKTEAISKLIYFSLKIKVKPVANGNVYFRSEIFFFELYGLQKKRNQKNKKDH